MDYYVLTPVTIFVRLIESFSQLILIFIILGEKIKSKKFGISVVLFFTAYLIGSIFMPKDMLGIISLFMGLIIIKYVLNTTFSSAISTCIINGSIVAITDCIVSLSFVRIFELNSFKEIVNLQHLYFIVCLIICLILLIIARIVYVLKLKNNGQKIMYRSNVTGLVNFIVTFILLIPNLVMILYYYDGKSLPLYMIIINICAIIAMFFVSTYNTKKGFELVTAEQELITQRTYNKTLQNLVDSLRTFKHDYNNTLQTMYGYIQLNNMSDLKKFFEQILDESRAITALDKLNPELFNNPSLFGIITAKYEYARQNHVNLNFEMYGKIEEADMQIYDLTRILGIFLDNAIEASTGSEKKKVNFMVTDRKGKIIIEISNTYSEVGLKVEDIDKKGVSSKGENRGLGLYKVKEIIKKYSLVKHETTAVNGMFRQKLVINKIRVKV